MSRKWKRPTSSKALPRQSHHRHVEHNQNSNKAKDPTAPGKEHTAQSALASARTKSRRMKPRKASPPTPLEISRSQRYEPQVVATDRSEKSTHGVEVREIVNPRHSLSTDTPSSTPEKSSSTPGLSVKSRDVCHPSPPACPTAPRPFSLEWFRAQALPSGLDLTNQHPLLPPWTECSASSSGLPSTLSFPLATPEYQGEEWTPPTPYNTNYPHPLTVYASPSVNSAAVASSGYAKLLRELQEHDPESVNGRILSECGQEALALGLEQDLPSGCGIPETLWLDLHQWAKVPTGAVIDDLRGLGRKVHRHILSPQLQTPSAHDALVTRFTSIGRRQSLPQLNTARFETDPQQYIQNPVGSKAYTFNAFHRRNSLPDLRIGPRFAWRSVQSQRFRSESLSSDRSSVGNLIGGIDLEDNAAGTNARLVNMSAFSSDISSCLWTLPTVHEAMGDPQLGQSIPPIGSERCNSEHDVRFIRLSQGPDFPTIQICASGTSQTFTHPVSMPQPPTKHTCSINDPRRSLDYLVPRRTPLAMEAVDMSSVNPSPPHTTLDFEQGKSIWI